MKSRNHPSIFAIKSKVSGKRLNKRVSKKDIVKEIKKLSSKKAVQNTDIPLKIIKENANACESHPCKL